VLRDQLAEAGAGVWDPCLYTVKGVCSIYNSSIPPGKKRLKGLEPSAVLTSPQDDCVPLEKKKKRTLPPNHMGVNPDLCGQIPQGILECHYWGDLGYMGFPGPSVHLFSGTAPTVQGGKPQPDTSKGRIYKPTKGSVTVS
jgi:hypothetical protein